MEIFEGVFLGDKRTAKDIEFMKENKIFSIINATSTIKNYFENFKDFESLVFSSQSSEESNYNSQKETKLEILQETTELLTEYFNDENSVSSEISIVSETLDFDQEDDDEEEENNEVEQQNNEEEEEGMSMNQNEITYNSEISINQNEISYHEEIHFNQTVLNEKTNLIENPKNTTLNFNEEIKNEILKVEMENKENMIINEQKKKINKGK
jgi:hypothetical protein